MRHKWEKRPRCGGGWIVKNSRAGFTLLEGAKVVPPFCKKGSGTQTPRLRCPGVSARDRGKVRREGVRGVRLLKTLKQREGRRAIPHFWPEAGLAGNEGEAGTEVLSLRKDNLYI